MITSVVDADISFRWKNPLHTDEIWSTLDNKVLERDRGGGSSSKTLL